MLIDRNSRGQSLLAKAASGGDIAMFEAVMTTIRTKLLLEEVLLRLLSLLFHLRFV